MKKTKNLSIFALLLFVCILYSCNNKQHDLKPQIFEESTTEKVVEIFGNTTEKDGGPCTRLYIHFTRITDSKGNVIGFKDCFTAYSYCGEQNFRWWGAKDVNCGDYKLE